MSGISNEEREWRQAIEAGDPHGRTWKQILADIELETAIEFRERRKEKALKEAWDWERKAYQTDDIFDALEVEYAYIRATGLSDVPARLETLGMLRQIQSEMRDNA